MQIIWIYGPPAVGKSTAAWQLYSELSAGGTFCSYVDIDQLGICYPAQSDDPERHRLKGLALASLVPNYLRAGAEILIVSGVLDPELIEWYHDTVIGARLVFCRLTIGEDELRRRHNERGVSDDTWHNSCQALRALDAARLDHATVETTGLTPQEVADSIRNAMQALSVSPSKDQKAPDNSPWKSNRIYSGSGTAIWVCGPTAVGKSVVAWSAYASLRKPGSVAAYIDVKQLGFISNGRGESRHALQAANAAALWGCFKSVGATRLVLSGPVDTDPQVRLYREALTSTPMTLVRLRAAEETLHERIRARGRGEGPRLADDKLIDQPEDVLEIAAVRSSEEQQLLDSRRIGDVVIDSTSLTPSEASELVIATIPG